MRYEEYEQKIIKRAKVLRVFYKLRFLIISVVAVSLISGGTLIATKGLVSDKILLQSSYTYGDKLTFLSSSFMSDVQYEFYSKKDNKWSLEEPKVVGEYILRARSSNSFNSYYYGNEQSFEIKPCPIMISINEDQITYGQSPTIKLEQDLKYGDVFQSDYTFKIANKTSDNWVVTPEKESLHVKSKSGADVSSCYQFIFQSKQIEVLKRSITIASSTVTKTYDGLPIDSESYTIKSGSLVSGDYIVLTEKVNQLNPGTYDNIQAYKFYDANGLDMTGHYQVTQSNGVLKINKRELTISSPNDDMLYDGYDKKFSLDDITIESGSVAENQTIFFNYSQDVSDKYINAGEYNNKFTTVILDQNNVDVTENYNITYDYGTTNILKRDLAFSSGNGTHTYDKVPFGVDGYEIISGSLADKDELSYGVYPTFTEVGEHANNISFVIVDKQTGEDVSSNYNFIHSTGYVTINPAEITVSVIKGEYVYDGKPHKNTFEITDGALVSGDTIGEKYNPERINVGEYDNPDFEVEIYNENHLPNSQNYNITYTGLENSISISKRPITITSLPKEKTYDGLSLRSTITGDSFYEVTEGSLADNEYIEFYYLNDVTNAGEYPIECEVVIKHQSGSSINPDNDNVVTSNYEITYVNNNFTINKRPITIQTKDAEHVYNRNPIIPDEIIPYEAINLADGDYIENLNVTCSGIDVGTYAYSYDPDSLVIKNMDNEDVTSNYDVTFVNSGSLTITKRPTTFTLLSDSKIYDGTPLTCSEYTFTGLLEDDYYAFTGLPGIIHVWQSGVSNTPSGWQIFMSNGVEVTSNYDITNLTPNGTLTIEKRPITVTSSSFAKTFDGQSLTGVGELTVTEGSLAAGDSITIISLDSYDNDYFHAGTYNNTFDIIIKNGLNENVTEDYDITPIYGQIVINPCPITLDVFSNHYIYDGQSHDFTYHEDDVSETSSKIYIKEGNIPSNFHIEVTASISNMKDVGEYNDYTFNYSVSTNDPHGARNSDFDITFIESSQLIVQRKITIQTCEGNKIKDGQPFGHNLPDEDYAWVASGSLCNGHRLSFVRPEIIDLCNLVQNKITDVHIYDENNNDVTEFYSIKYIYGMVTIYEY